jgi:hypothetical protein
MANRYWVGGTATWDGTALLKWALTSGGVGGQAVPTSADTVFFDANSGASTVTIGAGTAVCSTLTMANFTGTLAFGTNSITCAGTGTVYQGGASTFSVTGTPVINVTDTTAAGSVTISAIGATEANSISFNVSAMPSGSTLAFAGGFKNLNFTGSSCALANTTRTVYGNLTLSSTNTVVTGALITTFGATSGTQTYTTNGVTASFSITISGIGGTVQLGSALTTDTTLNRGTITLTNGTFDANNFNVTVAAFVSSNSNTRTLTMGSGTWTLTAGGNNTVWDLTTTTNLTFNKNTANIVINTATGTKTFNGGGLTYNNLTLSGAATGNTFIITGANTFATLASSKTLNYTLTLPASTTTTVTTWSVTGVSGGVATLNSSTAGTQATISQASGTVSVDYMNIRDSNATGGATFYAGANSTNTSNNTGWIFTAPPSGNNGNFFLLFA